MNESPSWSHWTNEPVPVEGGRAALPEGQLDRHVAEVLLPEDLAVRVERVEAARAEVGEDDLAVGHRRRRGPGAGRVRALVRQLLADDPLPEDLPVAAPQGQDRELLGGVGRRAEARAAPCGRRLGGRGSRRRARASRPAPRSARRGDRPTRPASRTPCPGSPPSSGRSSSRSTRRGGGRGARRPSSPARATAASSAARRRRRRARPAPARGRTSVTSERTSPGLSKRTSLGTSESSLAEGRRRRQVTSGRDVSGSDETWRGPAP